MHYQINLNDISECSNNMNKGLPTMQIQKNHNLVCVAKIIVKSDKLDQACQIFAKLKELSPQEPGCLSYKLHQDTDNPNIFLFIDKFKDMEAFNYHCAQSYTVEYFDNLLPGLTESMEFMTFNEIEIK